MNRFDIMDIEDRIVKAVSKELPPSDKALRISIKDVDDVIVIEIWYWCNEFDDCIYLKSNIPTHIKDEALLDYIASSCVGHIKKTIQARGNPEINWENWLGKLKLKTVGYAIY